MLVKDLLSGVATSSDIVEIVDLHPWNGDLAMALCKLRMSSKLKPRVRCWMVGIQGKNGPQSAFAVKRLGPSQDGVVWKQQI